MGAAWIRIVQVVGFLRKELMDVVRQPRLVVMLVFGPFLILLLFGIGYDDRPPPLKTVFVAPPGSSYRDVVNEYATKLSDWIKPEGFTTDEAAAKEKLAHNEVDVVVVFPKDPLALVLAGKQAPILVIHDQLDPIQQTAINFATKLAVDEVNSAVLAQIVGAGQQAIQPLGPARNAMTAAAADLGRAVQAADPVPLQAAAQRVRRTAGQADALVTATEGFFRQLRSAAAPQLSLLGEAHTSLADLQVAAADVQSTASSGRQAAVAKVISTVAKVNTLLGQLQTVDPSVLVQPFTGQTQVAVPQAVSITDYYAPGAIVLLIQHLGVTFGALSFVRDRALGLFEMLRIGPVTTSESLLGKYGAYSVVGAGVAAALSALVILGLDVPLDGQVSWVVIVLGLVLLASLGIGFLASLLAKSDSQAVQFAMIVLLASLFFGGFFLSLKQLTYPVAVISLLLPVRYGISALQDVMLRGTTPAVSDLLGLGIIAVTGYAASWYLLRRRLRVV